MPIEVRRGQPTVCIRRDAFERAGLTRAALDASLGLTDDEFHLEGDLVAVGPLYGETATQFIADLEAAGLEYFDDYFELSGNWPEWMQLYAKHHR